MATSAKTAGQPQQVKTSADSLLVVFTYGNFCSAEGRGNGLRDIAEAIRKLYPNQQVITRCWNSRDGIEALVESHAGPVALIGHSYGGCRTLELAAHLRRKVDWLVVLDPVPVDISLLRHDDEYFEVPPNVTRAICFYRPPGFLPISYGFLHTSATWVNRVREWGHSEFCESSEVQQCILKVCAWENAQPGSNGATAMAK